MRVLVAVDGSTGSQQAARLVEALELPPDTSVTLLDVVRARPDGKAGG